MKEVVRREYYLFSPWLRIFHWIMVVAICVLFATGLMITSPWSIHASEPTFSGMTLDNIRNIHFVAAYLFCAAFILRIYGFCTNPGDRLFPHVWKGYFYSNTVDVALHYMFLRSEHASYLRNPIARCSYAFLYVLVFIEILTGFGIYYMTDPSGIGGTLFGWVITVLGGEMMAHLVHHYVACRLSSLLSVISTWLSVQSLWKVKAKFLPCSPAARFWRISRVMQAILTAR